MTSTRFVTSVARARSAPPRVALLGAYDAVGLPAPVALDAVDAVLAAEPSLADLHAVLAAEALTTSDAGVWLEESVDRLARAVLVDELRVKGGKARDFLFTERWPGLRRQAFDDLNPAVDGLLSEVAAAAAVLPSGVSVVEPGACVSAGVGDALGAVLAALDALGTVAGLFGDPGLSVAPVTPLAHLVDFDTVDPARCVVHGAEPVNPDPRRDGIRQFVADATTLGLDAVLVRAARADYAGVTVAPVADLADRARRLERVRGALRDEIVTGR